MMIDIAKIVAENDAALKRLDDLQAKRDRDPIRRAILLDKRRKCITEK